MKASMPFDRTLHARPSNTSPTGWTLSQAVLVLTVFWEWKYAVSFSKTLVIFPWVIGCPAASKAPILLCTLHFLDWFKTIPFCNKRVYFKADSMKETFKKWSHFYFKTLKKSCLLSHRKFWLKLLWKVGVLIRPSQKKFKWRAEEEKRF